MSASSPSPPAELFVLKSHDRKSVEEEIRRPSLSYWEDAWIRLRKNKIAVASAAYIVFIAAAAIVLPQVIQYSYEQQEIWNKHARPNLGFSAIVVDSGRVDFTPLRIASAGQLGSSQAQSDLSQGQRPLIPPQGLSVMGDPTTRGIVLQWESVPGAAQYNLYRSIVETGRGIPLAEVRGDELSYLDIISIQHGETYFYTVTSSDGIEESGPSPMLKVAPKLALSLDDARKIDPDARVGTEITTHAHYFGTDYLGRDMLARVMTGARISLFIGFGAPSIYILIGILYGSFSGYFGGMVDDVMMRVADIISTIPELLTVIILQVILGPGVFSLIIALVVSAWARSARQIRGQVLLVRETEFIQAAKILGTPFFKIILRHLLPNLMGTIIVLLTLAIPQAIFSEAFLSFIGLGIAPPLASWGTVIREGSKVFLTYPHELLIPAGVMCVTMLAFNLLGDGLRDALDPRLRGAT